MGEKSANSKWTLAAFALPGGPLLALSLPPIIFLPPYYSEYLGLNIATVGALFLAARIFDVFVNPLIGTLQDRTRSSFGRRRTWMIVGTPVLMALIWTAFMGLKPGAPALMVGLAILAMYMSYASVMIAHLGWAGELRPTYHGRTRVLGAVQIASTIGQIGVLTLPAIVTATGLGDFKDAVHVMGWSIIIALPICVALCVWRTPETDAPLRPQLTVGAALTALRENKTLRRVLLPDFMVGITQGLSGSLFLFYFRHALGFDREAEALLLIYFASALAGVPLWMLLGRRIGKHRALQIGCIWWALAIMAIPLVPPGAFAIAAAGMVLAGIAQGAGILLLRSMMADVVDEDQVKTGEQRSGLFFGLLLTTSKVGLALGPASYLILAPFGFDPKLGEANTPTAMAALTWLFAAGPFLLNLLTVLTLQNYPLDEARQRVLRDALEKQTAASNLEGEPPSQGAQQEPTRI